MENLWKDTDRGKMKHSNRKPSQCCFGHHKSQMNCPVIKNKIWLNTCAVIKEVKI
jgi:hypothetical protein